MGTSRPARRVQVLGVATALACLSIGACGGVTAVGVPSDSGGADTTTEDAPRLDGNLESGAEADTDAGDTPPERVRDGGYIVCAHPVPLLVGGQDTGFDVCDSDAIRRRANKVCPNLLPRATSCSVFQGPDAGCVSDVDCLSDAGPYAMCVATTDVCGCVRGCVRDSDCRASQICACEAPIGRCVPGDCSGTSCAAGAECIKFDNCYKEGQPFACQTMADTCLTGSDCTAGLGCYVANGVRTCGPVNCGF